MSSACAVARFAARNALISQGADHGDTVKSSKSNVDPCNSGQDSVLQYGLEVCESEIRKSHCKNRKKCLMWDLQ